MAHKLEYGNYVPGGGLFQVTSRTFKKSLGPVHTHDFSEIFFVTENNGRHTINDRSMIIEKGDLLFIRPEDRHTFAPYSKKAPLCIVNVLFKADVLTELIARYSESVAPLDLRDSELPRTFRLPISALQSLLKHSDRLGRGPQSRLALDTFIMELFSILSELDRKRNSVALPHWLQEALTRIHEQRHFQGGVPEFIRLSCRCSAHVHREVKKYLGKTCSEVINEIRLEYAAQQLGKSDKTIEVISRECGFKCKAYFYKLFRERYKQTPRQYHLQPF